MTDDPATLRAALAAQSATNAELLAALERDQTAQKAWTEIGAKAEATAVGLKRLLEGERGASAAEMLRAGLVTDGQDHAKLARKEMPMPPTPNLDRLLELAGVLGADAAWLLRGCDEAHLTWFDNQGEEHPFQIHQHRHAERGWDSQYDE